MRLNLSGNSIEPGTPNHIERLENLQMDFGPSELDALPVGLKTPTSNVRSQYNTPGSVEVRTKQNNLELLKQQISSVRADLSTPSKLNSQNQATASEIITKLAGMLDSYEKVASEYESLLKQSIMAKKAGKLDGNISRMQDEVSALNKDKSNLQSELDQVRANLYSEMQSKELFKKRLESQEQAILQLQQRLQVEEKARLNLEEENQRLKYDNTKVRTELDIEMNMEEEQRRRSLEHENQIRELRARFEADLHQRKLQIADLQNEVALLKQTENILEEELKSRSTRPVQAIPQDEFEWNRENRKLSEQVSQFRRQAEEYQKLYEETASAKQRAEDSYRKELETFKQLRQETISDSETENIRRQYEQKLSEVAEKLRQAKAENDELSWSAKSANSDAESLKGIVSELELRIQDKDKRMSGLSERVQELEKRVLDESDASRETLSELESSKRALEDNVRRLSEELAESRISLNGPNEHVINLKRRVALIEREKELLEDQLRNARLSAYSHGEFQTFSSFIQGLKRHIDGEILSLDPMRMSFSDVVRAKEMVDVLMKVTDDVRIKVLTHLSQVENVIKQRQAPSPFPETVKIERVRNYDISDAELRRRLEFSNAEQSSRYLQEPLGVVNTKIFNKSADVPSRSYGKPNASLVTADSVTNYMRPLPSHQAFPVHPSSTRQILKVQEPIRCNLCHEYGHDSLSCTDYLSGTECDDLVLNDLRSNLRNNRLYNVTAR